jgi:DNA-binding response OmpR family regulator
MTEKKPRILVADDERNIRKNLVMVLMEGLEVFAHFRTLSPKTAVVIITAYGSAANAVEAMKLGAVDFLEKPFDPKIIGILAEEILFRQHHGSGGLFDDLMHLADLARELKET